MGFAGEALGLMGEDGAGRGTTVGGGGGRRRVWRGGGVWFKRCPVPCGPCKAGLMSPDPTRAWPRMHRVLACKLQHPVALGKGGKREKKRGMKGKGKEDVEGKGRSGKGRGIRRKRGETRQK